MEIKLRKLTENITIIVDNDGAQDKQLSYKIHAFLEFIKIHLRVAYVLTYLLPLFY